jgi:hypothetical protein
VTPSGLRIATTHAIAIVTDGTWIQISQRETVRIIRTEGVLMTLFPPASPDSKRS